MEEREGVGVVLAVKEAYGFIRSVYPQRDGHLFFHVSEVSGSDVASPTGARPSLPDLCSRGHELSFCIQESHPKTHKPAAINVHIHPPGSLLFRFPRTRASVISPPSEPEAGASRRVDASGGMLQLSDSSEIHVPFSGPELAPSAPSLHPGDAIQLTLLKFPSEHEPQFAALDVCHAELFGFVENLFSTYGFIRPARQEHLPDANNYFFAFHSMHCLPLLHSYSIESTFSFASFTFLLLFLLAEALDGASASSLCRGAEVAFVPSSENRANSNNKPSASTVHVVPAGTIEEELGQTFESCSRAAESNDSDWISDPSRGRGSGAAAPSSPLEQLGEPETGVVKALKESYGFIKAAGREDNVFFHFSTVNGDAQELQAGSEVVFRVSGKGRNERDVAGSVDIAVHDDQGLALGTCTQPVVVPTWRDGEGNGSSGIVRLDEGAMCGESMTVVPDTLLSKSEKVSTSDIVELSVLRSTSSGQLRPQGVKSARRSGIVRKKADKATDPPTPGEIDIIDAESQLGPVCVQYSARAAVGLKAAAEGDRVELALARDENGNIIARSVHKARSGELNLHSRVRGEKPQQEESSSNSNTQQQSASESTASEDAGSKETMKPALQAEGPDGTSGFMRARTCVPASSLPALLRQESIIDSEA